VKDFLGEELVKGGDTALEGKEDSFGRVFFYLEGGSGRNYKTDRRF
jgi:hypothetical protein